MVIGIVMGAPTGTIELAQIESNAHGIHLSVWSLSRPLLQPRGVGYREGGVEGGAEDMAVHFTRYPPSSYPGQR